MISEFPKAFRGTFVRGAFLYSDGLRKRKRIGKIQALSVKDKAKARVFGMLLAEWVNQNRNEAVLHETIGELGDIRWFFTSKEIESRKKISLQIMRSQGEKNINVDSIFYNDNGYAIAEGWLLRIQKIVYEELMGKRLGTSNKSLDAMLLRLRRNSEVRPIALMASWPYYWKTKIAGAIWDNEKKLRTKNQSFDMAGFDMKLRPMAKIKTVEELLVQLQIRGAILLADRVGKSMLTITPMRNGYRVAGGFFEATENE